MTLLQNREWNCLTLINASEKDEICLCTRCQSSLKRKKIPSCALLNIMCISEVPKELQGLNSLEERLISRIATFMTLVVPPRGYQRAIRSQVINFPTPMTNTVDQLPCPAEDADIVCAAAQQITETEQDKGTSPARMYYFRCYGKVMLALIWLRTNNPHYQNVRVVAPHEEQFTN